MSLEHDRDSSDYISEIESYLKSTRNSEPTCDKEVEDNLRSKSWLKTRMLMKFFEENYTSCLGLYGDIMDQAKDMHREFKTFLLNQQTDYHESRDFAMETIASEINFDDALKHTNEQIRKANLLLSGGFYEYGGIDVLENRKLWKHLRLVVRTAGKVDKLIKNS